MNKKSLALEVMGKLGEDTSDDALLQIFINFVQDAIDTITSYLPDFAPLQAVTNISTQPGVEEYTVPVNVFKLRSLVYDDGYGVIEPIAPEELVRNGVDFSVQGRPAYYYFAGYDAQSGAYKIRFFPVPDSAYSITALSEMSAADYDNEAELPLPREFEHVIYDFVSAKAYLLDKDYYAYDRAWQAYQMALVQLQKQFSSQMRPNLRLKPTDVGPAKKPALRVPTVINYA